MNCLIYSTTWCLPPWPHISTLALPHAAHVSISSKSCKRWCSGYFCCTLIKFQEERLSGFLQIKAGTNHPFLFGQWLHQLIYNLLKSWRNESCGAELESQQASNPVSLGNMIISRLVLTGMWRDQPKKTTWAWCFRQSPGQHAALLRSHAALKYTQNSLPGLLFGCLLS